MEYILSPNLLEKFDRTLRRKRGLKIVSFDLFDTLITRPVAVPSDLFRLVEKELTLKGIVLDDFASVRTDLEFCLRKERSFEHEVRLSEIYERVQSHYGLSREEAQEIHDTELEVEKDSLSLIEDGFSMLKKAAAMYRVIVVTDTYFSEDFIELLLEEFDINRFVSRIYCSSKVGVQKSTGKLFRHVLEEEKVKPKSVFHVGDNLVSDIEIANKCNVGTFFMNRNQVNRYEQPIRMEGKCCSAFLESRALGLSRMVRLKNKEAGTHKSTIWDVGCNVAAPLLISHVIWLLHKAQADGVKKLFFIARDGQILLRIAKVFALRICPNIELVYMYSSRNALLFPSIVDDLEEHWDWIFARTSSLTLRMIFARMHYDVGDFFVELKERGFCESSWDDNLDLNDISHLKKWLSEAHIKERIELDSRAARVLLLKYIDDIGVLEESASAFVDVGWNGTLQRSISKILDIEGYSRPVKGYYFGLLNRKKNKSSDELLANFVDQTGINRFSDIEYFVPLVELFVAATHGGTVAYESIGDEVRPKLRSKCNEKALSWGLDTLQCSIIALAVASSKVEDLKGFAKELGTIGIRNFKLFSQFPSNEEAKVFGSYLDAEDQNELKYRKLASPYRFSELRRVRGGSYRRHNNDWKNASMVITRNLYKRIWRIDEKKFVGHPVGGDSVKFIEGVGSIEGPVPELKLGFFLWIYGPTSTLKVTKSSSRKAVLRLYLRNFHDGQELKIKVFGKKEFTHEIPVNLGASDQGDYTLDLELPHEKKSIDVVIESKKWQIDDRPLAVLLNKAEVCYL